MVCLISLPFPSLRVLDFLRASLFCYLLTCSGSLGTRTLIMDLLLGWENAEATSPRCHVNRSGGGGCYSGHCSTPVICTGMELARVKQVLAEWLTPVFSPLENRINLVSPLKQLRLHTPTLLRTQTLQWTSVQNGESMNHV